MITRYPPPSSPVTPSPPFHPVLQVTKHGLLPKKCFPETFSCESSSRLNNILKSKLREYAR